MSQKIRQVQSGTISSLYVVNYFKYCLIHILGENVRKNQIRTILKYVKSSRIIFCAKMFQYFHIVYY